MDRALFQNPAWQAAATLVERVAAREVERQHDAGPAMNTELAARRLQRWQAQPPFADSALFGQRLSSDGLSEAALLHLLGEPVERLAGRLPGPPGWLVSLEQSFADPGPAALEALPGLDSSGGYETAGFLTAAAPLLHRGLARVRSGARSLVRPDLPFEAEPVCEALFASLPGHLLMMLSRTCVLELNVARLQGQLAGTTAAERYQSFLQRLARPETAVAFFQEYPVLARQLVQHIDLWVESSLEFLQRFSQDWESIRAAFDLGADPGRIVGVDGSPGDRHRGGRSVQIVTFASGARLVYKPKSLAVDVHFQELLAWLNARGDHPPLRLLGVLDRGAYGWVEFVSAQACLSPEDVDRFYRRLGSLLALLYVLEAVDFHSENLIAAGEQPVLIDIESLFHPRTQAASTHHPYALAGEQMASSVLRVGLLPQRVWTRDDFEGVDFSALGAPDQQLTPHPVPYWENANTDEMQLRRRRAAMRPAQHRPVLGGAEVKVLDHVEAIVAGFTSTYRLLLASRDALLAEDGPLARFDQDEVRIIVRPTQAYGILLHESFHPDLLRNALDRERFFDRLWVGVEPTPFMTRLIPSERRDLWRGDIPMFVTRPGSRDAWDSTGERIPGFLDDSGSERVRLRMAQMDEGDLARQTWFIRASLATLGMGTGGSQLPTYRMAEPSSPASRERLLALARAAGDRLDALALQSERGSAWIGLTLLQDQRWSLTPLRLDFYDGLPGVAFFLAYLGAVTGERRYTARAESALDTIRAALETEPTLITSVGAFEGWGGLLYLLAHLSVLWDRPGLLAEAHTLLDRLPALIAQDDNLDLINGAAGCLASLLCLHRCAPSGPALSLAVQCGERLLARALPMPQGLGWPVPMAKARPLAGFSHGAAGISWALLNLAALTGQARFREAALAGMAYERSLFSPQDGNWPDLRELDPGPGSSRFVTAWCHGAPGIGLGRLCSLPHVDDAHIRSEIEAALTTTHARGCGFNFSLCHGDLGNLELLMQAGDTFDPRWRGAVERMAAVIVDGIVHAGWLCGVPLGVETPGLMTGIAGIGYGLLRLADPQQVPSVLTLAPPAAG